MEPLPPWELSVRIGAAVVLGGLVGLERERKHRPAGFRTMILISLGSCAFMIIAHEMITQVAPATAINGVPLGQAELSRVLQGLIGGIGFLGAGAVIQNKRAVRGLTTAAAVWVTSAIGAACGMGLYVAACIVGGFTMFTLVVLEVVENRYFPDPDDDAFAPKNKKGKRGGKDDTDSGEAAERLRGDDE
jgi:putative Mg2+ transporter-C (MgtC) family protein